MENTTFLQKGLRSISDEVGILQHTVKLPRMSSDPKVVNFGVWTCNTLQINGENFEGRSGACNDHWKGALLGTLGETFERYAPAFYDIDEGKKTSYQELGEHAIAPSEFALFHPKQYEFYREKNWVLKDFSEDQKLTWFPTTDLTNNRETWLPGQFIYMPFQVDNRFVTVSNSTGLAAHTNYYKAILTGLYESVERDSFVITWMNELTEEKLVITPEIQEYLGDRFPDHYEWHFFDITYDLEIPTIFGICMGETEFGKFVAVGSATRGTRGEALKKVIEEIGQTAPYFRWLLSERRDWQPPEDFNDILSFADHSVFYLKRPDLWHVFDPWVKATPEKVVDLHETRERSDVQEIRWIVKRMADKGYNVLFKDISTPDVRQLGFFSIKVFIPQLIQLSGGYPFYFSGGKRLYDVPEQLGYPRPEYDDFNKHPHPFP